MHGIHTVQVHCTHTRGWTTTSYVVHVHTDHECTTCTPVLASPPRGVRTYVYMQNTIARTSTRVRVLDYIHSSCCTRVQVFAIDEGIVVERLDGVGLL